MKRVDFEKSCPKKECAWEVYFENNSNAYVCVVAQSWLRTVRSPTDAFAYGLVLSVESRA